MIFADWRHLGLAGLGVVLLLLLGIWWRRLSVAGALACLVVGGGLALTAVTVTLAAGPFVTPLYYAGCPLGCPGRRGYPLPFARMDMVGGARWRFSTSC